MNDVEEVQKTVLMSCKVCGGTGTVELVHGDNGACGDPECCGGYEEYITFLCTMCGEKTETR